MTDRDCVATGEPDLLRSFCNDTFKYLCTKTPTSLWCNVVIRARTKTEHDGCFPCFRVATKRTGWVGAARASRIRPVVQFAIPSVCTCQQRIYSLVYILYIYYIILITTYNIFMSYTVPTTTQHLFVCNVILLCQPKTSKVRFG